jgi:hypothetical protein
MVDAQHTPPGDRSFVTSVVKHLAGAVALVLVVSAAFWAVGQVRTDDGSPTITAQPGDGTETVTDEPTSTADPANETSPSPAGEDTETEPASPTETDTETTSEPPAEPIDPATISVQVLDAVVDDDGEAASGVASSLRADGYRVVAENQAVRQYEQTTVFYTSGNEDAARQIAAAYGFEVVQEQPGNLSEDVDVHVVVGLDDA